MDFYAVQRLVGKINDSPEIRDEFIKIFDTKTKQEMARFGLALGEHLFDVTGFNADDEILNAFNAVQEWIDGKANYHKARNLAGALNDSARDEKDPIKSKLYRNMAQIACIPHVKFHALWACDFAVAIINKLYPDDIEMVQQERNTHIKLFEDKKCKTAETKKCGGHHSI